MERRLSEKVLQELEAEARTRLPSHPNCDEQSLTDRVRRSLSWLKRTVAASPEDAPPRFLELWISLNALYGRRPYVRGVRIDESGDFRHYITRLKELDSSDQQLVPLMKRLERRCLRLIENQYLWKEFWRGEASELKREMTYSRRELRDSLSKENPVRFFACVFERLQILRNQIAHGSSRGNASRFRSAPTARL